MDLTTQISGGYGDSSRQVFSLKQKLQAMNIKVTHPIGDGSIIMNQNQGRTGAESWPPYDICLDYYESIRSSDFHVLYNDSGYVDEDMARELVYAMSVHKPVVLLYAPLLGSDVGRTFKRIIESRLSQLIVCDIRVLDDDDTLSLLSNLAKKPTSYALSNIERAAIRRSVRAYFRKLVTTCDATPMATSPLAFN